jgi:hypothetical protein
MWCRSQQLPEPVLSIVSRPSFYSISTLPPKVKETIAPKLVSAGFNTLVESLFHINNEDEMSKMINFTVALDNMRNQNFKNAFPEMNELLQIYK